jgi:hypothetical protein
MFVVIVMAIFALQLLLITFAGSAFGVYSFYGLQPVHWGISVIIVAILGRHRISISIGESFVKNDPFRNFS